MCKGVLVPERLATGGKDPTETVMEHPESLRAAVPPPLQDCGLQAEQPSARPLPPGSGPKLLQCLWLASGQSGQSQMAKQGQVQLRQAFHMQGTTRA